MSRATRALINLAHIKNNFKQAELWAPNSKNMAIIKANAYGHGALQVAKALEPIVPAFGVAIFEEAVKLRNAGIKKGILVLQGASNSDELATATQMNIWLTVHNLEQVRLITSTSLSGELNIWLKLDTGMHRLGLDQLQFEQAIRELRSCSWVNSHFVISSHFSCASNLEDNETELQFQRFKSMLSNQIELPSHTLSIANSPAIAGFPNTNLDWNRPGIMLYGLPLFDKEHPTDRLLKPAMTFESTITAIREVKANEYVGYSKKWSADKSTLVATVAVGYADGYPRQAQNGTPILVRGQRAKLVGAVSMDLISIDVSDVEGVKIGDRVELWGESLSANEVAGFANTIGYDLISGVSQRVPRFYLD